jgi:hypothetical protein
MGVYCCPKYPVPKFASVLRVHLKKLQREGLSTTHSAEVSVAPETDCEVVNEPPPPLLESVIENSPEPK